MAKRKILLAKRLYFDTWLQELFAIVVSTLAYLAILILFVVYDGKPDFQWHGLTLNATVSALSTTSRLLLLITISSCIGQLRWNTFASRQTPVSYMDSFDGASRGVLGCFTLLWETRSRSVAAIGAWLTILAVAFEPSIQQALRFTNAFEAIQSNERLIAEISSAVSWGGGLLEGGSAQVLLDDVTGTFREYIAVDLSFSMLSAMYNGLVSTPAQTLQQTPFTCSSGNCNWRPYLSLAVCSACYDVKDQVTSRKAKESDKLRTFSYYWTDFDGDIAKGNFTGTVYMLPHGLAIWNVPGFPDQALMTTKTTSRWSETMRFRTNNTLIFAISMLQLPPSWTESAGISQLTAKECGLYFCVKSYESSVKDAILNETVRELSSTMDPSSFQIQANDTTTINGPNPPNILYDQDTYNARTDIRILPPTGNASAFSADDLTVSQPGAAALVTQARLMFNSSNVSSNLPLNISIGGGSRQTKKFGNVFSPPSIQSLYNSVDIDQTFATLASAMTNDMRRNGRATEALKGKVGLPVTKVHIRWGWVAFSAALVAVGSVFLLTSILLTRKVAVPLWKTNALALLFHQLRPFPFTSSSRRPTVCEMVDEIQHVSAKLGANETLEVSPTVKRRKRVNTRAQDRDGLDVQFYDSPSAPLAENPEQADEPLHEALERPDQRSRIVRKPVPTSRAVLIQ